MSDPSLNRLETLYQVSQALGSTLDLDTLLNEVIDQVIAVTGAERGFLMLGDESDELQFRVARGIDHETIEAPEFQVSRGVLERVAEDKDPLLTMDAQSEDWLSGRESVHSLKLRSIMCVPLQVKGNMLGLVYVDNRLHAGMFEPDDLDLLQAVASTSAVAIENARLHLLEVEQARLERELEVARQVQTSLIPVEAPQVEGYEIAGLWRAAREVAGDFYDFVPRGDDELTIVIGDVAGKGVPAAFFMALARTTMRACLAVDTSTAACVERANRLICADASSGMFVTLYCIGLHPKRQEVTCASAGHNPPLWVQAAKGEVSHLPKGSIPLGIEETFEYSQSEVKLEPGDLILLYTDGVVDTINSASEFFEEERLSEILKSNAERPLEEVLNAIRDAVDEFAGEMPPYDDMTLVAVRYLG